MKTLMLQSGDLVVGGNGHKTITGSSRIRQDLALALGEHYGNDRFHPQWGSVLPDYVGRPIAADTEMLVRSEVSRVVQAYIDAQNSGIVQDSLSGARSRYTTGDVIAALTDISTVLGFDTIRIMLSLVTRAQENLTISRTVSV